MQPEAKTSALSSTAEWANRRRACPACEAVGGFSVEVATEPRAEALSLDQIVPYWAAYFKARLLFTYARCNACGLLYCPSFADAAELSVLYSNMPPNMEMVPVSALRRTQSGYFEVLKRHGAPPGGYLEVGPDVGYMVEASLAAGYGPHWLFEPNRAVWPELARVLTGRPHRLSADMLDYSEVPDRSIGAAVLIQVFDHLLDPVGALRSLKEKLTGDGVVVIVTHDESSLLRKALGSRWPAFTLQHPQLYNPETIAKVVERSGLRVVATERTTNYFPVDFLLRHLAFAVGFKDAPIPGRGIMSVGLKLGNMITVAKR